MRRKKRAIGYVCDIPVVGSTLKISKEDQKLRILKHADKQNLELVCIYEDELFTENPLDRPGVNKVFNTSEEFDVVLVERVWALSSKMKDLKPVLANLETRRVPLVATSYLWDCVSQRVRHRYSEDPVERCRRAARATLEAKHGRRAA